jgi:molybdate transport system substrate-binding protein
VSVKFLADSALMRAYRIAAGVAFATLSIAASAADITVFAASSLKEALDEQVSAWSAREGHRVRVSYAGSNALARQIESGAPAHLFISADEEWMDYLVRKNLVVTASRRDVVGNDLVLIAPGTAAGPVTITPGFPLAAALAGGRLAVANPAAVPAGKYAKAALTKLGVWTSIEGKLARAENVRAALAFVARAEAPLGIVYRTDALAEPKVSIVGTFPADSHPAIVYPAALVAGQDTAAARALLDALVSADGKKLWRKFGFTAAK